MANAWFRMYAEFAHDPKVQMMTEAMQRRYLMLMCMRCSNALVTLHDEEIAFHLRIDAAQLAETKALFVAKGFINEQWELLNWEKRQFASDSSAQRVAKHRAAKKEAAKSTGNDYVTLHEAKGNALDTDTEEKKKKPFVASATEEGSSGGQEGESSKQPKPEPSPGDHEAARWLLKAQQKVTPKMRQPNLSKWAHHIRLLREVDGRTHREICELFQWAKSDVFWSPNCQCPQKLREKWDQLSEKRARASPAGPERENFERVL